MLFLISSKAFNCACNCSILAKLASIFSLVALVALLNTVSNSPPRDVTSASVLAYCICTCLASANEADTAEIFCSKLSWVKVPDAILSSKSFKLLAALILASPKVLLYSERFVI
jgi:hypothetical protein